MSALRNSLPAVLLAFSLVAVPVTFAMADEAKPPVAATQIQDSAPAQKDAAAMQAEADKEQAALKAALVAGPAQVKLGKEATLALPKDFVFLPEKQARQVLEGMGNHVAEESLLGLILPKEESRGWFIVAEFRDTGFRKDDDAGEINADEILKQMQESAKEDNVDRAAQGQPQMEVVGWIEKPHYNKAAHQLVWSVEAKELGKPAADNPPPAPGDKADLGDKTAANAGEETIVNYNTFTLGRKGDLSLNLVTGRATVDADKTAVAQLLAGLKFDDGKRYEDFDAKTDKVAAYGLMGLIGVGLAKQAGLFGLLALGVAKFGKLLLIAAVGGVAALKKLLGRDKDSTV